MYSVLLPKDGFSCVFLCLSLYIDLDIHEARFILLMVGKRLKNVLKSTTMSLCDRIVQFVSWMALIHASSQLPGRFLCQ